MTDEMQADESFGVDALAQVADECLREAMVYSRYKTVLIANRHCRLLKLKADSIYPRRVGCETLRCESENSDENSDESENGDEEDCDAGWLLVD